jgi:oligo-alginate lyase
LPARLLDGYGMGILNNRADSVGAALYYGVISSHGHFDRLHFELFANGQSMMPDLGYPDGANDLVPGIFSWSKNTIAHNTVVVDASRQPENVPGTVELFADGKFARVMDISAAGTYPQCTEYRRAMIQVDCGGAPPDQSYFVDIFTVAGGKQHDYSLHGPPGTFRTIGEQWSEPAAGTLAGENVEIGQLYDDAKLGAAGYKGGYGSYRGSGFQHLYNVRRHESGEAVAEWSHEKDPTAKLRIRVLPQTDQQLILANARVSPIKHPQVLTYLIARRQGDDAKLASRFVSVIEPFKGQPLIKSVRAVDPGPAGGVAVEVTRADGGTDLITYAMTRTQTRQGPERPEPRVVVLRRDRAGALTARFLAGDGSFALAGERFEMAKTTGAVISVDPPNAEIRVKPDDEAQTEPEQFLGRVVQFQNDKRRTAHTIAAARRDGQDIVFTTHDDLLVGRARVDAVRDRTLATRTALPLAPIYRGVTLASESFDELARVSEVRVGSILLATPIEPQQRLAAGDDVWLVNVGSGDRFELPAMIQIPP